MKQIIISALLLLTFSCSKENEDNDCKTCDNVVHEYGGPGSSYDYITETKEYCNGTWEAVNGQKTILTTHSYSTWKCR
jgi:hypothetical protein